MFAALELVLTHVVRLRLGLASLSSEAFVHRREAGDAINRPPGLAG